jgi:ADP-ribose pyrophosphatase YjhB (NUDIX family)
VGDKRVSILEAAGPLLQRVWSRLPVPFRERVVLLTQPTFTVGVSGVVLDDRGRVLLLRNRFRYSSAWQLPGGFVGRGEALAPALAREISEETGLEVHIERLIAARVARPQHLDVCYSCHVSGEPALQLDRGEILDGRFFERGSLPGDLSPEQREMVRRVLSNEP